MTDAEEHRPAKRARSVTKSESLAAAETARLELNKKWPTRRADTVAYLKCAVAFFGRLKLQTVACVDRVTALTPLSDDDRLLTYRAFRSIANCAAKSVCSAMSAAARAWAAQRGMRRPRDCAEADMAVYVFDIPATDWVAVDPAASRRISWDAQLFYTKCTDHLLRMLRRVHIRTRLMVTDKSAAEAALRVPFFDPLPPPREPREAD